MSTRKTRFSLGPSSAESSPQKKIPKYKAVDPKRTQNIAPKPQDPIAEEVERMIDDEDNQSEKKTTNNVRGQLEVEYRSELERREMLLQQLAICIENKMKEE